jgi:hypothetical protein
MSDHDDNKLNLQYFQAPSMNELFVQMQGWQAENRKRLQSVNVQRDGDLFCCIALTNPSEVIIVDGVSTTGGVDVTGHALKTYS